MQTLDKPEASSAASINDKTDLTPTEAKALKQYEKIISKGRKTFIEVGNALVAIQEQRLYRRTHKSFQEYCIDKWEFTARQANRFISASEVVKSVTERLKTSQR
jgi:hypothetical protein